MTNGTRSPNSGYVWPTNVHQRKPGWWSIAAQSLQRCMHCTITGHPVMGYSRHLRLQRHVPLSSRYSPRRKPFPQTGHLDRITHIVFLADVINTIMRSALPLCAQDTGYLHNWPKSRWMIDTWRAISCTMFRPQNVQAPVRWARNWALQSRRINSRSVCLFDIPATRETGHCRRNVLNSSLEREGLSTRVTSRNLQGAALSSGISTRTLFWALPGSTCVSSAPSLRARKPITSGTAEVSNTTTPAESKVTIDSGAFHGTCSCFRQLIPLRSAFGRLSPDAIAPLIRYTVTVRRLLPNKHTSWNNGSGNNSVTRKNHNMIQGIQHNTAADEKQGKQWPGHLQDFYWSLLSVHSPEIHHPASPVEDEGEPSPADWRSHKPRPLRHEIQPTTTPGATCPWACCHCHGKPVSISHVIKRETTHTESPPGNKASPHPMPGIQCPHIKQVWW